MKSLTIAIANPRYVKTALTPSLSLLLLISKNKIIKTQVLKEGSDILLEEFVNYFLRKGDPEIPFETLGIPSSHKCYEIYLYLKEKVRFGDVITYGELGKVLGVHPRFVGFCMKVNPFPVIVPCHRVLSKKSLGGYSAGVEIKIELLKHEGCKNV